MSELKREALRIGIIGMDTRVRNTLALAFKHRARGFCAITESTGEADVILFDMDAFFTHGMYQKQ